MSAARVGTAPRLRLAGLVVVFGLLAALVAAPAAGAAEAVLRWNIAAGELGTVLTQIGAASHRAIAFPAGLTRGLRAGPISGEKTVRAAIDAALAGTGLVQVGGETGPVTVRAARVETAGGEPAAAPSVAGGARLGGAGLDLPDIDVLGDRSRFGDHGFQAGDAGVVTRIQAPIKELPLSVTAITHDVLRSQAIVDVGDAAENVAGVVLQPGAVGAPLFQIRGFNSVNTGPTVNGALTGTFATVPIDDIDRIEVLKGPTSILTGTTQEGGLVNITTKAPTEQTIRDVTVRYGSFGYKTLAFDLGGIVPQTEGLTYRLNMSGNQADTSYGGAAYPHENLISPALRWQDSDTRITLGLRYYDTKAGQLPQTIFDTNGTLVPIARGVAQGGSYFSSSTKDLAYYSEASHEFGRFYGFEVSAHNSVAYDTQRVNAPIAQLGFFAGTTPTEAIFYSAHITQLAIITTERADITLKHDAGFMKQTARFGFDFVDYNLQYGQGTLNDLYPIDLSTGYPNIPVANARPTGDNQSRTITPGASFTDKIDMLNDRLHIFGSVREDHFRIISADGFGDRFSKGQYGLSWVAGGAFDLTPWMTLYGNRSNGFSAQNGVATNGAALPPQGRDQSEIGARFFLFDKLTLTTSVYDLSQTNIAIANPINPNQFTFVGGQESKGLEVEAQGQVTSALKVIASFTDQDAHYDPAFATGSVGGIPQFAGSLWTVYELQGGPLRGLSFGAGAQGNSASTQSTNGLTTPTPLFIPGYVIANAAIGYHRDKYELNFKLNNVLDKKYYYSAAGVGYQPVIVGEGRNFLLAGTYHF